MADLVSLEEVSIKDLPQLAQRLIELIGFGPAIRLVELRPGVPVYVPETITPDHWLAIELGMIPAQVLVKEYPGITITVPNCKLALVKIRQRQILKTRQAGYSQTETALLHGVTPRWIHELESREPEENRNLPLF